MNKKGKLLWITECYPSANKPQYCIFLEQQIQELSKLGYKIEILIPVNEKKSSGLSKTEYNSMTVYKISYYSMRYKASLSVGTNEFINNLDQLLDKENYDLISTQIVSDEILYGVTKVAARRDIKFTITFHGCNVWKNAIISNNLLEELHAKRRKSIISKANAIICVSNKVSDIVKKRLPKMPIYIVYNGVNTKCFKPLEAKVESSEIRIVAIGNLIPTKGFQYLIEGLKLIVEKYQNCRLYILGQGPEKERLARQVEQLYLKEYVVFVGYKPYDAVKKYLQSADIFILPSYYEALGCVYLEAMACGVATIGVRTQGIDEIIVNGENGLLVEPKDAKSITEQLIYLISNKEKRKELGLAGRKTAEKFSWVDSAISLDTVYQKVLHENAIK